MLQRHPERLPPVLALLDNWLRNTNLGHPRRWLDQWREMLMLWPFAEMRSMVLEVEGGRRCDNARRWDRHSLRKNVGSR